MTNNEDKRFYVYEWYNVDTGEVFYVGKGCGKRFLDKKHRNDKFIEYVNTNNVLSRKVIENLTEEEAFNQEFLLTRNYKEKGQCSCCLMEGGYGGTGFIWTPEMKEYWSKNNPMKREEQRQRMREYNPMKNKEISSLVGEKHKRAVIVQGIRYDGLVDAAKIFGVNPNTIGYWCQKGYDTPTGSPCYYEDEGAKNYIIPDKHKKKNNKPVLIDGEYFSSQAEAARNLKVSVQAINYALKNNGKCRGHKCEYANQQPSQ